MPSTEITAPQQNDRYRGLKPFQPGQSGNPAGRPKGARAKLGEAFLEALLTDFVEHGVDAIRKVRDEKPSDYVKVVASILPKEFDAGEQTLDILSELMARIDGGTRSVAPENRAAVH